MLWLVVLLFNFKLWLCSLFVNVTRVIAFLFDDISTLKLCLIIYFIFNTEVEATKIPPEWHAWIHHLIKEVPTKAEFLKYEWQKDHQENKTGTKEAYSPNKYKVQTKADYESWRP